MSRDWNGLSLRNEFAAFLSNESDAFKALVLGWINDVQLDICSRSDWGFLIEKGKKVLTVDGEKQSLLIATPTAPTLAALAGGSLVSGTAYKVLVTYVESVSGIESKAGTESASITPATTNLSITATIPVSADPLVTSRNIYLIKGTGEPLYYGNVANNTATTTTITADVSSTVEAPDYDYIMKIIGNPFIETASWLEKRVADQLRLMYQGAWGSGTPELWAPVAQDSILMYPPPSTALTCSFYYKKRPPRVYAVATSQPFLAPEFKLLLKAGVKALAAEHRKQSDQTEMLNKYLGMFGEYVPRLTSADENMLVVRDTNGDSDGNEI